MTLYFASRSRVNELLPREWKTEGPLNGKCIVLAVSDKTLAEIEAVTHRAGEAPVPYSKGPDGKYHIAFPQKKSAMKKREGEKIYVYEIQEAEEQGFVEVYGSRGVFFTRRKVTPTSVETFIFGQIVSRWERDGSVIMHFPGRIRDEEVLHG